MNLIAWEKEIDMNMKRRISNNLFNGGFFPQKKNKFQSIIEYHITNFFVDLFFVVSLTELAQVPVAVGSAGGQPVRTPRHQHDQVDEDPRTDQVSLHVY